jgi:hypothetical protein
VSDHRPVFGLFEAKVRRINEQAKAEIEEKLIQKFKSLNPKTPLANTVSGLSPIQVKKSENSLLV